MKAILRTAVAASVALAVVSCGGSNTPGPAPKTTIDISGEAIKGTIQNGAVQVYRADDMTLVNTIGTPTTDENGSYSFQVSDNGWFERAYVVKIVATENSTMICDAKPTCGDVEFGDIIPSAQLDGLSLSSITSFDGISGQAEGNVNVLTTLTTDVLLASAAVNENIKLSSVSATELKALQEDSSEIVGDLIGVDLSDTNVFDIKVVDATKYTTDSVADVTTDTLSVINASYAGLPLADGEKMSDTIDKLTTSVTDIATVLLAPDFENADLLTEEFVAANDALTATLEAAEVVRADIETELVSTNPDIEIAEITTEPAIDELVEKIEEASNPATGATGASN